MQEDGTKGGLEEGLLNLVNSESSFFWRWTLVLRREIGGQFISTYVKDLNHKLLATNEEKKECNSHKQIVMDMIIKYLLENKVSSGCSALLIYFFSSVIFMHTQINLTRTRRFREKEW
ncbi:unnamed protein product [Urochloa humidicola]